jgi:CRP/FNR family transcriptional regulator, cyclic AMP receptor protein
VKIATVVFDLKEGGIMKRVVVAVLLVGFLTSAALCAFAIGQTEIPVSPAAQDLLIKSEKVNTSALSKALVQVNLFTGLTDAERDALKTAVTLRHTKAGERIIEQGTTQDRMFIILDGQTEIRINGQLIVTYSGQSLVGELEFLDPSPACADVLILQETDLIELNYAALTGLMEIQPRLGHVLMREFARIEAQRLRAGNQK